MYIRSINARAMAIRFCPYSLFGKIEIPSPMPPSLYNKRQVLLYLEEPVFYVYLNRYRYLHCCPVVSLTTSLSSNIYTGLSALP